MDGRDMLECDGGPQGYIGRTCWPCRYASETTGGCHEPSGTFEVLFNCLAEKPEDCPFSYDDKEE